jgi:type I restriction enzyme M protein
MDYWAETMQDDCYLIADAGWKAGAQPREIRSDQKQGRQTHLAREGGLQKGKRRFKSDLVPADLLIARYFSTERDAIAALEAELASIEQQLDEKREEHSGEDGLLAEVIEGEGEKQKITAKAIKARLKELGRDPDYAEERQALEDYAALLDQQAEPRRGSRPRRRAGSQARRQIPHCSPRTTSRPWWWTTNGWPPSPPPCRAS